MREGKTVLAIIPARAGSKRVPGKNIKPLAGHPLIAYSISAAIGTGLFDRIIVSTDSIEYAKIAEYYGAEVPFLRPEKYATSTSPDIEYLKHALAHLDHSYDCFAKLNPTSPFRTSSTITRAVDRFLSLPGIDSIRAVQLCHEHPGKMWTVDGELIRPFLDQGDHEVAWHARQYQDLPEVYIQDSSIEVVRTNVVHETNTREGNVIAPFFSQGWEGFAIDYEQDWMVAEYLVETGKVELPEITLPPYS